MARRRPNNWASTTPSEYRRMRSIEAKRNREGGTILHVCIGCGKTITTHPSEICEGCYTAPFGE